MSVSRALTFLGLGAAALATSLTQAGCGTSGHARDAGGAAGMGATGGSGATGGGGGAGSSGKPGTGGSAGGSSAECSKGVGSDALIATFDEGATIADRNYPILGGAMPGGTYAYVDPSDTTAAVTASVVDGGHTCKALAMSIESSSFRGMGFWTSAPVDATSYTGISFWARRGEGSADPTGAVVSLGMDAVTADTGSCSGDMTTCVRPQLTITLTDTWTQYSLYWSMFTPGSDAGTEVPASGELVNGLDFSFQLAGTTKETTVLELDDVAFLTSSP